MKSNPRSKPKKDPPMTGDELGRRLLKSIREINAGKIGRVTHVEVNEVLQARHKTGLSQSEFASALHISRRTLQEWEQGRRVPSGAAQTLIRIAHRFPNVVKALLP